jgi:hypothetical protein
MESKRFGFGLGLLLGLGSMPAVWAVEPLALGNKPVVWSQVIEEGSGPIVYDRYRSQSSLLAQVLLSAIGVVPSPDQSEILSSWSRSAIRVTRRETVQVVDEVVSPLRILEGDRRGKQVDRSTQFIYREEARDTSPLSIELLIKGRSIRYESGPVSAELAAALAQAPEDDLAMQLCWPDGTVTESRIGEGTVREWKRIFR